LKYLFVQVCDVRSLGHRGHTLPNVRTYVFLSGFYRFFLSFLLINETPGFTMLKYMERKGRNQFVWGTARDTLKTNNRDIIREVEAPIPVSSRLFGLPKDVVKDIENMRVKKWVVYYLGNFLNLFFPTSVSYPLAVFLVLSFCPVLNLDLFLWSFSVYLSFLPAQ